MTNTISGSRICDVVYDETIAVNKQKRVNNIVRIIQFLSSPFLFLIFHSFLKPRISGRENFKQVKTPFILIVKHSHFYDGYLLGLALGFFTPHLPLRVMSIKKFDRAYLKILDSLGIVSLFYTLFGNFIVVPGTGTHSALVQAREILKSGNGNVVMFPEGGLYPGEVGLFKKGASVLAIETGLPVIPVSFREIPNGWGRSELVVNIGEPISVQQGLTPIEGTEIFRNEITRLYNKM